MAKATYILHTDFSDGLHSPRQVVQAAYTNGMKVIAVTDHDTLEGPFEPRIFLRRPDLGIQVIVGEKSAPLTGTLSGFFE